MKRYSTYILVGIIVVLAAGLVSVLLFLYNQPPQVRGFQPLVEISPMDPVSSNWGINFPNQYTTFLKTKDNKIDTTYGGSSAFSHLENDPLQVILFAGYGFSKDYNDDRGHMWSLTDVRETKRVNEKTPGTCYSCKTANNPALWKEMGMAEYDKTPFSELGNHITEPIGCANCHETGTMRLIVTNPALEEALQRQGKDWTTFTRQEMRSLVCANCHVEYYFAGEGKYLTFPWDNGFRVEDMVAYYESLDFNDWSHPISGAPMLKAQHPEYEMFVSDSTHYNAGVSCADCHMSYVRDGAAKFSTHDVKSPLLNAAQACGQCHANVDFVITRVKTIQDTVFKTKIATEEAIVDAIKTIEAAAAIPTVDQNILTEARKLHRISQFYWDYVSAENSMGFHNPEEALRILAESTNLARQAQLKAVQAAGTLEVLAAVSR